MKINYKVLGLLCVSAVLLTAGLAESAPPQSDESLCQVTLPNGNTQDLSKMCGQSNNNDPLPAIDLNTPSPVAIDLNTPSPVVLVGRKTPSQLWNTLPDLKEAPTPGKTKPVKPSNDPSAKPIQATDPD
ncbi:MAG: hypothetical protein LH660_14180 [Phormidesmis sp. CAN_BIN36]|nr:hypothetical protein [Phormidesmis sp. CAN_BIN36]